MKWMDSSRQKWQTLRRLATLMAEADPRLVQSVEAYTAESGATLDAIPDHQRGMVDSSLAMALGQLGLIERVPDQPLAAPAPNSVN